MTVDYAVRYKDKNGWTLLGTAGNALAAAVSAQKASAIYREVLMSQRIDSRRGQTFRELMRWTDGVGSLPVEFLDPAGLDED